MKKLMVEHTVGFMLKVLKLGNPITKFHKEFAAIRHGNYDDFIGLIGEEKPILIGWKDGIISNQNQISQKSHCDFAGLVLAGPSLKKFFGDCVKEFGEGIIVFEDEISNDIYGKLVLFELGLRMHANNNNLINEGENLYNVINKLCSFKSINSMDIELLHKGRLFLNDVKHHNDSDYIRKFESWTKGIEAFEESYFVLNKNRLIIL